ncbi:hypothetical protein PUN28_018164 [Cardiocondyla obscurior]|uniref:Uncharacterized protein n=1 Tax=Cardiocondyla obscurior TaxID=286306 RepID=A0AAW2ELH9_9HYME
MRAPPGLCLAETITSLIETKTIADRHLARGRSSRAARTRPRRLSPLALWLANRVSGSRGKSKRGWKSEGHSPRSICRSASGCASRRRRARRSSRARTRSRNSSRWWIRYIPLRPARRRRAHPFLFTTRHPRKGTWGSAVYLHGDTQARVYVRAHALPQPSL